MHCGIVGGFQAPLEQVLVVDPDAVNPKVHVSIATVPEGNGPNNIPFE